MISTIPRQVTRLPESSPANHGIRSKRVGKGSDLSSGRSALGGLLLFLLGFALIGWKQCLLTGVIVLLVGSCLMFASGHYYFRKEKMAENEKSGVIE